MSTTTIQAEIERRVEQELRTEEYRKRHEYGCAIYTGVSIKLDAGDYSVSVLLGLIAESQVQHRLPGAIHDRVKKLADAVMNDLLKE